MGKLTQFTKLRVLQMLSYAPSPLDSTTIFNNLLSEGIKLTKPSLLVALYRWEKENLIQRTENLPRTQLTKKNITITSQGKKFVDQITKGNRSETIMDKKNSSDLSSIISKWILSLGLDPNDATQQIQELAQKIMDWHFQN